MHAHNRIAPGRGRRSRVLLAWPAVTLLAACTVGPDYHAPALQTPATFTNQPPGPSLDPARLADWWHTLHDPLLDMLVARALDDNEDVLIARQRVVAARTQTSIAAAAGYPTVNYSATAQNDRSSTTLVYPPGIGSYHTYQLGFDASWEIDVFGSTRRAEEAARATATAQAEQLHNVLVSLLSELASDYVMLRATQVRLTIARQNIAAARRGLDLATQSFDRGLGTDLEVAQAQAQLETQQATVPPLQAGISRLAHGIALLVGSFPEALEARLTAPAAAIPAPPLLPSALPSVVVTNRPDIRAAERSYAAAHAEIGVAVAAEYPRFSIPLGIAPASGAVNELFRFASLTWTIAASVSGPVLDGGLREARVTAARAQAEVTRLQYERTVKAAFRDVEDALVAERTEEARNASLRAAARDSRLALDRARRLFEAGLTDFLRVLDAERQAYSSEDLLAQSDAARVQDRIALYKAVGGGWQ